MSRPDFMISEGLVVTPSIRPRSLSSRISFTSAVSTKNFIFPPLRRGCPGRSLQSGFRLAQRGGKVTVMASKIRDKFCSRKVVPVLVPMPSERPYTYAVPEGMEVGPGSIVAGAAGAAAGGRGRLGRGGDEGRIRNKLREITQVFDCPPLNEPMRRFIDWVARYTLSPPGMVARMALRAPAAFDPEPPTPGSAHRCLPERMTAARERVLEHGDRRAGLDASRAWRMRQACR
jgi:hypothetical protein